ncbi:MAG: winged helix-turn-helix transcriptional regulator [Clostridiaceae bacterium]|nr:winged helix-turn-helix transcriptional regulator [Clostridiaceae bacterium]
MEDKVEVLKALADKNRLLILEMLSCGELCACDIIDGLNLTQPTISHHMKILQHCKLVNSRKEGKWVFYSINEERVTALQKFIRDLTSYKEDCVCKGTNKGSCHCK